MTSWTEMTPAEFDASLAKSKRERQFIATAGDTMFPRLMPESAPKRSASQPGPMPGEVPLFDLP